MASSPPSTPRVAVVTGGSSGIGLATVRELIGAGMHVSSGDMAPLDLNLHADLQQAHQEGRFRMETLDVTDWENLSRFFASTYAVHQRLDYAFINAGVGQAGPAFLKQEVDEHGALKAPDFKTVEIDLLAPMSTAKLALWYMQKSESGGCLVFTASSAGYAGVPPVYYAASKHGVVGLMRALYLNLQGTSIRVNAVAPSWTETKIAPAEKLRASGIIVQSPVTVAKDVLKLFVDGSRNGQVIYSEADVSREIEEPMRETAKTNLPTSTGMTHFEEALTFLSREGAK